MLEIREVRTGKELDDFIRFPFHLYRDDPFFSPELIKDQKEHFSAKNPFFKHADVKFFLARMGRETVGRVASIVNRLHLKYQNEEAGFFGFFESVDNTEVSGALLNTVSRELRRSGMKLIRGPMNFSTNEQCGFLLEGYNEPPMLMTPHNPPYYHRMMEDYGMRKAKDLLAFITRVPDRVPEKIVRVAAIAEKRGIRCRHVEKKNLKEDLMAFRDIYNQAWAKNWGFVPLTEEEVEYMGNKLREVMVPELTLIAEKDGEPVGFLGLLPDFNLILRKMNGRLNPFTIIKALYYHRKIRDLRMLLLGVKPSYRIRGVDALLFRDATRFMIGRYERVEFSWILEENEPVKRLVGMAGGRLYKRYRIYEKETGRG